MFAAERMEAMPQVAFEEMKVKELQAELAAHDVSKGGRKAALQHRLHALIVQAEVRKRAAEAAELDEEGGEGGTNGEAGANRCADSSGSAGQQAGAGTEAQEQASGEVGSAGSGEAAIGDQWWDEHTAQPPRKEVRKIKSHHPYSSGAQEGSLATVYMSMEFADGTDTGRGGYVPSEPYLADEGFRADLRRYVATKKGKRMLKYVPAGVLDV